MGSSLTGFCGALVPGMQIGHIVVANKITTVAHDELAVDVGMTTDLARGLHVGRTVSIDHMVRSISEKQALANETSSIAVDMETHAVAAVCRERTTRFLAVAVSDDLSADLPPKYSAWSAKPEPSVNAQSSAFQESRQLQRDVATARTRDRLGRTFTISLMASSSNLHASQ